MNFCHSKNEIPRKNEYTDSMNFGPVIHIPHP